MILKSLLVVAVVVLPLAAPTVAGAAPSTTEDPEALIRIGNGLRRKGDDKRAEGYLKRAYELAHTPRSEADLGLCELALGRFRRAEEHLSEALAADDSWVQDNKAALISSRDKARAKLLAVEIVGAPRDATVVLPDSTVTKLPADGVLYVDPGDVKLSVQAGGHKPAAVEIRGVAGEKRKAEVAMPSTEQAPPVAAAPAPAAAPTPAPAPETRPTAAPSPETPPSGAPSAPPAPSVDTSSERAQRIAGIVVGAVGVAAAATGVVLLVKGNSEVDTTNAASRTTPPGVYDPANGNYETLQHAGVGLVIGGAAAVAVGGTLFVLGLPHQEAPTVSFNVGPGGGLLQLRGAF
jgi:hypothetical protein